MFLNLNPWTLGNHGYGGLSVSVATAQQTTSAPWATQAPPLKAHGQDFIRNTEGERETDIVWFFMLGGTRLIWLLKIYASSLGYFSSWQLKT